MFHNLLVFEGKRSMNDVMGARRFLFTLNKKDRTPH